MEGDIRNPEHLATPFENEVDTVVHFPALKAVDKSCEQPLDYFSNNIGGTIALMRAMEQAGASAYASSEDLYIHDASGVIP